MSQAQKLVILCDGTWCGREAGTESNIALLAQAFGIQRPGDREEFQDQEGKVKARYFKGIGLGRSFLYYLFDGATGSTVRDECVEVYKFIAQNYHSKQQIWMFGLSRGAFTVRCVAGMINNCGIVNTDAHGAGSQDIFEEVYDIYRSPHDEDHPKSEKMAEFRAKFAHPAPEQPPVKFMGLFDTVGSLGIPRLNPGVTEGGEWPEFHDQVVSSVVEKVYHAMSLHDRLWIFQPCRASRDRKYIARDSSTIEECWFPGCHYDLGRQQFEFLREGRLNSLERLISKFLGPWTNSVVPNPSIADLALRWMLQNIIRECGDDASIISKDNRVNTIRASRWSFTEDQFKIGSVGSGDVYGDVISYLPGARTILGRLFRWVVMVIPGVQSLLKILLATRDRRVACNNLEGTTPSTWKSKHPGDDQAVALGEQMIHTVVFNYKRSRLQDPQAPENSKVSEDFRGKYPSKTYEMHDRYCCAQHSSTNPDPNATYYPYMG